jgi:hypothetical protein
VQWRGFAIALALVLLVTSATSAQTSGDADQLFSEGLALLNEEKFSEALVKLEQAQALDPGIGTQFNIGLCYEKLGKLGTAWRNYASVEKLARAAGKTPREESARAKLEALRPLLSTAVVTLAEARDVTVKIDEAVIPPGELAEYPVDPGPHALEATAPARVPFRISFDAPLPGSRVEIKIPVLALSKEVVTVTHETTNTRRAVGFAVAGVGVAALTVATVTGIVALDDHATAERSCHPKCLKSDGTFDQNAVNAVDQGRTLLPINVVAWAITVVGLGVGTYLLVTSSKKATVANRYFQVEF